MRGAELSAAGRAAALVDLIELGDRLRKTVDDADRDDDRHAVSDAFVRDLFTEPHQDHRAAGQDDDREEHERGEVAADERLAGKRRGQAETFRVRHGDRGHGALNDADDDREVAGVLVDLVHPGLAFTLEAFERGKDGDQELHDDGGGDVGHDAERSDGELLESAAAEEVDHAQEAAGAGSILGELVEISLEVVRVDTGARDVGRDPADDDDRCGKKDLVAEILDLESVDECFEHVASISGGNAARVIR